MPRRGYAILAMVVGRADGRAIDAGGRSSQHPERLQPDVVGPQRRPAVERGAGHRAGRGRLPVARHRQRAGALRRHPVHSAGPAYRTPRSVRSIARHAGRATSGPGSGRTAASCATRAPRPGQLRLERRIRTGDGLAAGAVRSLVVDRDGTIWAGHLGGLFRFSDGRWCEVDGRRAGSGRGPRAARRRRTVGSWSGRRAACSSRTVPRTIAFAARRGGAGAPRSGTRHQRRPRVAPSGGPMACTGSRPASAGAGRSPAPKSAAGSASCTTARDTCGWVPEGRACGA